MTNDELKTRGGVKLNLFALWIEKGIELLQNNGNLGLIVHKNLLKTESYKFLRKYIIDNVNIKEIFDLGPDIFKNVVGETVLLILNKSKNPHNTILINENVDLSKKQIKSHTIPQDIFKNTQDNMFNVYLTPMFKLEKKILDNCENLDVNYDVISFGLNTTNNKKYFITFRKNTEWKKAVMGRNLAKWRPKSFGYVLYNDLVLTRKGDVKVFESSEKIIMQRISAGLVATYDNTGLYCFNSINMILPKNTKYKLKYLLCILNSKLINYYYKIKYSMKASLTVNVTQGYLSQIPIKIITVTEQEQFVKLADQIIKFTEEVYIKKHEFLEIIKTKFNISKTNNKLKKFYNLPFSEFFSVVQTLSEKNLTYEAHADLLKFFNAYKQDLLNLLTEIDKLEKTIDTKIYKLYDVSEKDFLETQNDN